MTTKVYIVQKRSQFQSMKWFWVDEFDNIKEANDGLRTHQSFGDGEYRIIKRTIKDEVIK